MFDVEHFGHLNYIKKEPLSGSYQGMRYLIQKKKDGDNTYMQAAVWPEPLGFHATPEEKKTYERFTLDQDGIVDVVSWLNSQYENYRTDI